MKKYCRRKTIKIQAMSCNSLWIPAFVVKIRGQKVSCFVRFTFRVINVYRFWQEHFYYPKSIYDMKILYELVFIQQTKESIGYSSHDIPRFLFSSKGSCFSYSFSGWASGCSVGMIAVSRHTSHWECLGWTIIVNTPWPPCGTQTGVNP